MSSVCRVLVVAPSWLGDAAMATPAFTALRAARPGATITLLCRPGIDSLLADLGAFDRVVVDGLSGLFGPLRTGVALRRERFDEAVLFPNSFRTALTARFAGARRRIGYARDGRGALLTDRVAPSRQRPRSTVAYYCALIERMCGIEITDHALRLGVSAADRAAAEVVLRTVDRPFALLIPGGNNPAKRWPAERFATVAEYLARRGVHSVLSGSPAERAILAAVRAAAAVPVTDLSAEPVALGTLKAIVSKAALMVTNDTGPRHIAAAFGVPTVALFGPTDHRWTTLEGAPERVILAEPFLPDDLVADDRPAVCRIDRIDVADVISAIEAVQAADTAHQSAKPASVADPR